MVDEGTHASSAGYFEAVPAVVAFTGFVAYTLHGPGFEGIEAIFVGVLSVDGHTDVEPVVVVKFIRIDEFEHLIDLVNGVDAIDVIGCYIFITATSPSWCWISVFSYLINNVWRGVDGVTAFDPFVLLAFND